MRAELQKRLSGGVFKLIDLGKGIARRGNLHHAQKFQPAILCEERLDVPAAAQRVISSLQQDEVIIGCRAVEYLPHKEHRRLHLGKFAPMNGYGWVNEGYMLAPYTGELTNIGLRVYMDEERTAFGGEHLNRPLLKLRIAVDQHQVGDVHWLRSATNWAPRSRGAFGSACFRDVSVPLRRVCCMLQPQGFAWGSSFLGAITRT